MNVLINHIYTHYKQQDYLVKDIALHEDTKETYVVYQALYGEKKTWIRTLKSWCSKVIVDGKNMPRFKIQHLFSDLPKDILTYILSIISDPTAYLALIRCNKLLYKLHRPLVDNKKKQFVRCVKGDHIKYYILPNGWKHGPFTGSTIQCNYKDNKLDGEHIEYWQDHSICTYKIYKDNKLNGEYKKYHKNGELHIVSFYKDNKLDGEYIEYRKDRTLKSYKVYKDDKINGKYIKYWQNGEDVHIIGYSYDNLPEGEYIEYWENGIIQKHCFYKNGKLHGKYEYFDRTGISQGVNYFEDGRKKIED